MILVGCFSSESVTISAGMANENGINTMPSYFAKLPTFAASQICLLLLLSGVLPAQTDAYTAEQLQRHFQETAENYEISVGGQQLTLKKQPLMNWKNPVRTQSRGALYVWELKGRPQVLGSIFTFEYNDVVRCRHELISLADQPLTAKLDADVVWSPNRAGAEWTPCEGDLLPAQAAARRLFQMRSIARRFTGKLETPDGQTSTLTLIPQPLLRYQSADDGIMDGAVFSLAQGTDPEILLAIEARRTKQGCDGVFLRPDACQFLGLDVRARWFPGLVCAHAVGFAAHHCGPATLVQ